MQTRIWRAVTLMILTVTISRNSFGQIYDDGNEKFRMSITHSGDDSAGLQTVIYKAGPVYVIQMKNDKIVNFSVDGRNIPADGLGQYQGVIDTFKVRLKETEEQARRDREQAVRDREQAERDREQAGKDREQAERDRLQAEKDREQADRDRQQAIRDREQAGRDDEQAERDRQQAGRDREQAERDREQAEVDRKRAEEDRKMLDSLMSDLVADGVVPNRDSIHSLKLNADEIVVNGKELSAALEKKYLARYAKKGCSMSYHNE